MRKDNLPYLDMQLNRRQILFYLSVLSLIFITFGKKLFDPLQAQIRAKKESHIETDTFFEQHREKLAKIEFGATLCPAYLESVCPEATPEVVVAILTELKIEQLRFSMRWSRCVNEHNQVDLSYYLHWLHALSAAGIKITLGCGPIKSPRYPEAYVPHFISFFLEKLSSIYTKNHPIPFESLPNLFDPKFIDTLPPKIAKMIQHQGFLPTTGQHIYEDSPLAIFALDYLEKFMAELTNQLGSSMQHIVMFNPENESRNPFGAGKYIMELSYLTKVCQTILASKPDAAFLFNSAGVSESSVSSLEQTASLAKYLQELYPLNNCTVGIDSYEETNLATIPFLNFYPDTISGLSILYQNNLIHDTLAELAALGINFEATELQFERWIQALRDHPPGTLYHLQFMLLRYMQTFLRDTKQLVRLWGFEVFVKKYLANPEDTEIKALIKFIATTNTLEETALEAAHT